MESDKKAVVAVEFPLDVLIEILSRLPVKNLIRLKSVCKTWLQLISSQEFIRLHLNSSYRAIIHIERKYIVPCPRLLPNPPNSAEMISVGSSSDGLVCLSNWKNGIIHIWNPAIHKSVCIPIKKPPHRIKSFWFGRHEDEYKLVLGTKMSFMYLIRPYVDYYSWKSTQQIKKVVYPPFGKGTFFNGNVHWIVLDYSNISLRCTILFYDLRKEMVGEILMPVPHVATEAPRLGEIDGCLSALLMNCNDILSMDYELWVMKEYGVKESWTKLMVLDLQSVILYRTDCLLPDDPATMKSPLCKKAVYVESLVSPMQCSELECEHNNIYYCLE